MGKSNKGLCCPDLPYTREHRMSLSMERLGLDLPCKRVNFLLWSLCVMCMEGEGEGEREIEWLGLEYLRCVGLGELLGEWLGELVWWGSVLDRLSRCVGTWESGWGFLGLSGAILIQVYRTMFEDRPSSFLLMLAVLPTVVPLLLMYFVKTYQTSRVGDKKHLNGFSIAALVIAAYLMILIILQNIIVMNLQARIVTLLVLLSGLASPIGIAVRAHLMDSHRLSPTSSFERTPLLDEPRKQEAGNVFMRSGPIISHDPHNELSAHKKLLTRGEDLTLLQTMCTIDFWLLFVAMSCAMGSGLATVNNISQIGGSLGYTTVETSTLVSLWSIWNFLGRFGAGYVSDYFLHLKGWPRPIFMVVTLATMSVGHIVVASGLPGALYAGSILVGVCYGSQWSLMPTITSEIFGVRHMGTIFNTISIASPIGSYILSVWLVGSIYDKEASPDNKCTGAHCFMLSFLIMACVSLVGFVIALGLFFRTRRFYKQVIFEKLRQSATRLK
ncbi:hypothetical protein GIB67_039015 [Kingdonia uniflora]|uniref:Nodulin-like domain-containing protein n=1 Tax=Kingdonia uniflora TaxID=39325 RepID=A0A7J7LL02_9MAGN|nr:hypothetical protein GIB67_039015 [Kingdonia uniflora]